MIQLTKMEADLLALEVVATAIAGVSYEATNSAIEYAIANNLNIDTSSVSVGIASLYLNNGNPTNAVKVCFRNPKHFDKWDLWSPTLKIDNTTIADEALRLSTWLHLVTNDDSDNDSDNDVDDDDIDDYIKEEEGLI